jgi:16S rRNA (guanine966-N2)-methyltransferase
MRFDSTRRTGSVRIIGGRLRGSKLAVPDVAGLRPTPDRVRETLFNWLAPMISGATCLDLFAGTGALGIEALSRGAGRVDFVERDAQLARALRDNLTRLGETSGDVRQADALSLIAQPAPVGYDLVFLDPPFGENLWEEAARRIEAGGWFAERAWIYVESPAEQALTLPSTWRPHRERCAGAVRYALFDRSAKLAAAG